MPKTAVIYARFSCNKQREASIEDQLRICSDWCSREGYQIVATYCDYAISGRTDDRPQFQLMIDHAGESDIVLVYMYDRFSRDPYDAPYYKRRLKDKGVTVISATEAMPDSAEAIILEKIYEGLAAVESAHISERTKRGMEGNALKCMHNGVPVYGYSFGSDGHYVINEDEAPIVQEVFARKLTGEPSTSIATDLARRGIQTSYENPASHTFVKNMLKNEKYKGVYKWGDVRIEGGMPAIVDEYTWEAAQMVQSRKNRTEETWDKFVLSGKAICLGCGRNLVGVSGRGRGNKKYTYYRCGMKCGATPVRTEVLEGEIVKRLREILADRDSAMEIAKAVESMVNDCESNLAALESARKRKEEAQRSKDNLLKAVAKGLPFEDVKDDLEYYTQVVAAAEAEEMTYECAPAFNAEDFCDFLQFGVTLTDGQLLDALVYQVWLGEEEVTVILNFDIKESEPARFTFPLVRTKESWLPG